MIWADLLESLPLWSSLGICFVLMAAEVLRLRQRMRGAQIEIAPGKSGATQHSNSQAAGPDGLMPANREQLTRGSAKSDTSVSSSR
jgi:hypothetical protein